MSAPQKAPEKAPVKAPEKAETTEAEKSKVPEPHKATVSESIEETKAALKDGEAKFNKKAAEISSHGLVKAVNNISLAIGDTFTKGVNQLSEVRAVQNRQTNQ